MTQHNTLEWQNLQYSVAQASNNVLDIIGRKTQTQVILNNVSGCVHSGDLVAILGPSGSGKTTLLAAISQRLRGNVKGSIFLNGCVVDRDEITRVTCYLPQYDIWAQNLTALEHLLFMCHFKMDKSTTSIKKYQVVNELLLNVGLLREATTLVSKLSGGERRRLSVAEELIRDPYFVFCDEPTTGLDSFNALSVIRTLRNLTEGRKYSWPTKPLDKNMETHIMTSPENISHGAPPITSSTCHKGVICTIHQPSSEIFELFTHIILLSGGQIIYQGKPDDAALFSLKKRFSRPKNCNPADLFLRLLSQNQTLLSLCKLTQNNPGQELVKTNNQFCACIQPQKEIQSAWDSKYVEKISWCSQVFYLLHRSTKNVKSAFYVDCFKTVFLLITAVTVAVMYMDTEMNNQSSIQNIQGIFFMMTCEIIFTSSYAVLYEFPTMLPLIRREVGEKIYSLSAYYIAQFIRRIPQAIIQSFLFLGMCFAITNILNGFIIYLKMGITLTLASLTAISYGLFLSSVFESNRMASEIAAPFDLVFLLCGGFYLNLSSIPILKYVSLFFYTYEALSVEYWIINDIDCFENIGLYCFQNGTNVLRTYELTPGSQTIWLDYAGLFSLSLVLNCLAFFCVSRYVKKAGYY